MATVEISVLMEESGVGFGTSGARGRVEAMTDRVCYLYTRAFIQHLEASGQISAGTGVAIAGDYRPSTPRIMAAVSAGIRDAGYGVVQCGNIPSPAVALYGIEHGLPSIMVTGSHIPDDRNGIKFNTPQGEILKADEAAIRAQSVSMGVDRFDPEGAFVQTPALPPASPEAYQRYVQRYLGFFPATTLQGLRIGLYEHSSVIRDAAYAVLTGLGAEVTRLGYSARFMPVDTEAIRPEDVTLARQWSREHGFDAIVSADGDADRPLIADEHGEWLRGDIVGILTARYLRAAYVVTPISSNSAVEKSGLFRQVLRTRIGSPYVIATMQATEKEHAGAIIVGYEANGGFLTETAVQHNGAVLPALPTRDAILPLCATLALAREQKTTINGLLQTLPPRYTHSDRLKEFPTAISQARLAPFQGGDDAALQSAAEFLGPQFAAPRTINTLDGIRITLANEEVIHLRPSGNAPELRCYTEADSLERAQALNVNVLQRLARWRE